MPPEMLLAVPVQHGLYSGLLRREFALDGVVVESLSQDADLAKVRVSAGPLDALLLSKLLLWTPDS